MTKNKINNTSSDLEVSNININNSTIATVSTNANLIFAPNGTGNLFINRLSFNNGINYLNFYKVETFTPIVNYQLGGGSGQTYALQQGIKIRLGNLYFLASNIILTSKGIATNGDDTIVTNGGFVLGGIIPSTTNYVNCIVKNVHYTVTVPTTTELKYNLGFAYFNITNSGNTGNLSQWLRYRDINDNSEFYWSAMFIGNPPPT